MIVRKERSALAQCPKCGETLRFYHIKPECPFCGVNMVYYNANARLLAEAEAAEIAHAKSQPGVDRAKAASIGSPKAIARLALSALPLGALFGPLASAAGEGGAKTVNAIGLYTYISNTDVSALPKRILGGDALAAAAVLTLLSAVLILWNLIAVPFSLGPHGKIRDRIRQTALFCSAAGAGIACTLGGGRLLWGGYLYLLLLFAVLIFNVYLQKTGLPVKATPCLIGGLPSERYFQMKADGAPEAEIRRAMVEALTAMQEETRRKEAIDEAAALNKRAAGR